MMSGKSKSLLSEYDDLLRRCKVLYDDPEKHILQFIDLTSDYYRKYNGVSEELCRLQGELVESKNEIKSLQLKLKSARQMFDVEKGKRIAIEKEKFELERQIYLVKNMLNQGNINETMERLQVLSSTLDEQGGHIGQGYDKARISIQECLSPGNLSTINEDADTMGSIINISDLELTDADDLEISKTRSGRSFRLSSNSRSENKRKSSPNKQNRSKNRKLSNDNDEDKENNRRNADKADLRKAVENHSKIDYAPSAPPLSSNENADNEQMGRMFKGTPYSSSLKLPFTPTQSQINVISHQNTPVTPMGSSTLFLSPGNSPMLRHGSISKANGRQHCFASKMIYWTDFCQPCEKRIKFGKPALKCRDCRTTCHSECQDAVPLPCVPTVNTPGNKNCAGSIADFAPRIPPMVPAIIVHCTNEVESRGLTEVGMYRIPGADREVKELRDRFIKGKGIPNLANIDIYVVSSAVKAFLRALREPVIPSSQWKEFVAAVGKTNVQDSFALLYQAISDMPQPNRDTLSWIMVHLQRVAECVECKMPLSNLAKVFGPTLLGYSSSDPSPQSLFEETKLQQLVIELLLDIPSDYWKTYLAVPDDNSLSMFASPEKQQRSTHRRSILSFTPLPQRDYTTPKKSSRK